MTDDPRCAIARLLDAQQPASVLLVSPDPHGEWLQWCRRHSSAEITPIDREPLAALEHLGRADMALVVGMIETLDREQAEQLIGRLRNVHTEHVYVLVGSAAGWCDNDWFALALVRVEQFDIGGDRLTLYGYDLANYQRIRSWNNPRFWANPERWGRYWW